MINIYVIAHIPGMRIQADLEVIFAGEDICVSLIEILAPFFDDMISVFILVKIITCYVNFF